MDKRISKALKMLAGGSAIAALALTTLAAPAAAQAAAKAESYIPTIWIDPDGCEHWAMDDGAEGYMDNHLTRDGRPVCHRNVCGVMPTDQLFDTDRYVVTSEGRKRLENFFKTAQARSFIITGHTDSRASDEYNMGLSQRRANAVAKVAEAVGGSVLSVQWYGERNPRAGNDTAAGMAQNRRVEIICVK